MFFRCQSYIWSTTVLHNLTYSMGHKVQYEKRKMRDNSGRACMEMPLIKLSWLFYLHFSESASCSLQTIVSPFSLPPFVYSWHYVSQHHQLFETDGDVFVQYCSRRVLRKKYTLLQGILQNLWVSFPWITSQRNQAFTWGCYHLHISPLCPQIYFCTNPHSPSTQQSGLAARPPPVLIGPIGTYI